MNANQPARTPSTTAGLLAGNLARATVVAWMTLAGTLGLCAPAMAQHEAPRLSTTYWWAGDNDILLTVVVDGTTRQWAPRPGTLEITIPSEVEPLALWPELEDTLGALVPVDSFAPASPQDSPSEATAIPGRHTATMDLPAASRSRVSVLVRLPADELGSFEVTYRAASPDGGVEVARSVTIDRLRSRLQRVILRPPGDGPTADWARGRIGREVQP